MTQPGDIRDLVLPNGKRAGDSTEREVEALIALLNQEQANLLKLAQASDLMNQDQLKQAIQLIKEVERSRSRYGQRERRYVLEQREDLLKYRQP
jgi:hypothetical protein